ncbi:putative WD repeat-containing protein C17D11.16 [Ananas comosus]|uniref:Putative WD repeat-containing protein C17D11.16 n=1 Tax=Ananas comosus TaxID=4615 RepID=A0A199W5M7_ANACO|nr:putative WD repeat-containing protein C17D11.16 [Ananas comosus]
MISAISWIPKGASKIVPLVAEQPSKEEIEEVLKSGVLERSGESEEDEEMDVDNLKEVDEVAHALAAAKALGKDQVTKSSADLQDISDILRELNMDHYDDEDEDCFKQDDEDEEEIEDMTIKPTDAVIVCARNEDEVNHLEACICDLVWIYEETEDGNSNMYVHHDVILSAFPLCIAWLDCNLKGGDKGNFIAVGSMEPAIEIWDLDLTEEVLPFMVLGGVSKKKKENGKKKYKKDSHRNSVLGLAWNKEVRLDKSITLFRHYEMDMRSGERAHDKWSVMADVESLAWDPHNEHSFVVSLENGIVQGFDSRVASSNSSSGAKPTFTLHAHEKAVSSVSFSPSAPNLLATGSMDKMVKIWDLSNNQPSCVASRNPKAGAIFSVSFSEDSPFSLAIGGSKGRLQVWDTLSEPGVARSYSKFSNRRADPSSSA